MLFRHFLSTAALCLAPHLAQAAGLQFVEVPADGQGPALRGAVWYPCAAPDGQVQVGRTVLPGVKDCPFPADSRWPLVVVSHGSGGSFLGHHDTAEALADAGFAVAAISHPGDNFQDLSRQGELSVFASRPVDMRRLVDHLQSRWPGAGHLAEGRVGFFGFSRGGYTGLVAAGAVPDFRQAALAFCAPMSAVPLCAERRRQDLSTPPVRDPRIRAAVIVDPLNAFTADGLKAVAIPLQLWASEQGGDGVTPDSVEALRTQLPTPPARRVAAGAAHFAYLAPCSPAQADALPAICRDAPPFDRAAFHRQFNAEVLAFFRTTLRPAAAGPSMAVRTTP